MNSPIRLAINGYGRIGRCFLRALHESPLRHKYQIVAINEPSDLDSMAYLSRFDSTHGVFPGTVERDGESLIINGDAISVSHADTPDGVDWGRLGRSEEDKSELQSPMRNWLAVFCLKKKNEGQTNI